MSYLTNGLSFAANFKWLAIVAGFALLPQTAFGWAVYNNTPYTVKAKISGMPGGNTHCGDWDSGGKAIQPGGSAGPNYTDRDCNPTGKRDSAFAMQLFVEGNGGSLVNGKGLYQCFANIHGGGFAIIYAQPRSNLSLFTPPNLYCVTYFDEDANYNGKVDPGDIDINHDGKYEEVVVDYTDYFAKSTNPKQLPAMTTVNRDVRFLITGDPQYWNSRIDGSGKDWGENAAADWIMAAMGKEVRTNRQIRGMIVSGDLTQNAMDVERDKYVGSITGIQRFVFEGLGNHDIQSTGYTSHPDIMRNYVGEKARATIPTLRYPSSSGLSPHYSWDWHDVHFVQLDLFPGDSPSRDHQDLDPRHALSFLTQDLALNVGNSGRPVVLIHHYGFDPFSVSQNNGKFWWTEVERIVYWNVIKKYNIISIFTGHEHLDTDGSWVNNFNQPAGASARPDGRKVIPAYTSGAARDEGYTGVPVTPKGVYLDVKIDNCNHMAITRKDVNGPLPNQVVTTRFTAPGPTPAGCH